MPPSIRLYEQTQNRDEDLILAHLGMVKRVAVHLKARIPPFMEIDELVQVGMIGLIEAARAFDPTKVVFMIFAESTTALAPLMAAMQSRVSGLEYELVDESCALSLALMSKCKHHVFGASAFGFWGAFDVCDCVRTSV